MIEMEDFFSKDKRKKYWSQVNNFKVEHYKAKNLDPKAIQEVVDEL